MIQRKPLLLALAAAGLLTGASLPEAYSEDVFVAELAALEAGLCGDAAGASRSPALIRLAQAGKTEVGPAAPAASVPAGTEIDPPLMEPPYWYYPVRQTLGALLALKGEHQKARDAFRDSLARTPNNGWALYGLAQTYAREGLKREARAVERHLARAWFGERRNLDLARL